MVWNKVPTSIGQAYLIGDEEDEDGMVLVLTLSDGFYCIFHNSEACNHIEAIK
jgi:hypothetical protein